MWSYKHTSSASLFVDQCRVGARLEAATSTSQLVELFSAVSKEQRCKCYFFDAGTERHLASPFKTFIARPDRGRRSTFIGMTFPADFPCHRSTKATSQRAVSFIKAMGLDDLDLLIVPWPSETQGHRALSDRGERQRDGALFLKTWKALQRLVDAGTIRALAGVERFLPWQLDFVIAQPGPKPAVNFVHVSLRSHQRVLAAYSHARQVEVVASLDTADVLNSPRYGEAKGEVAAGVGSTHGGSAVDSNNSHSSKRVVNDDGEAQNTALFAIAAGSDMTTTQVVTSWSMHRGLVTLHTAGSLGLHAWASAATSEVTSASSVRKPRGSSVGNTELGE
ncbi:unnamed protein product [Scytosiphon promiscuus]